MIGRKGGTGMTETDETLDRVNARVEHALQRAGLTPGMTFDEVQFELGVATQCGRCETCARDVVAQCSASHPVAAIHRDDGSRTIQLAKSIQESNAWNSSGLSLAA